MRKYLTKEEVLVIHESSINEFGGLHGLRDENSLESAIMRPQSGYYQNINEEASALMESAAINHCFVDGNKRISFFATDVFLRLNGYFINCKTKDGYRLFIENLENNSFQFENILKWLSKHIEVLEDKTT